MDPSGAEQGRSNPSGATTEQATPPQPEARRSEITSATQSAEVQSIASPILHRKVESHKSETTNITLEDKKKLYASDRGKQALGNLAFLYDLQPGDYTSDQRKIGYEVYDSGKQPPDTKWEVKFQNSTGETVNGHIVSIAGGSKDGEEEFFDCFVETTKSDGTVTQERHRIPRQEVVNSLLVAEKDTVLSQFEGVERDLIEIHINAMKPGEGHEIPPDADSTKVNETIKKAAEKSGMLTVDDAHALAESQKPGQDATPEQKAKYEELTKIIDQAVNGKNLLDVESLTKIVEGLGVNKEEFGKQIQTLEAQVKANPNNENAKAMLELYRKASSALENNAIGEFFAKVQEGKVDPQKAALLKEAFRTGNTDALLESVILNARPDLGTIAGETPEEAKRKKEEKEKEIQTLKSVAKDSMTLFALLLLLVTQSSAQLIGTAAAPSR